MTRHPPHLGIAPGDALFTIPAEDRVTLRRSMARDVERLRARMIEASPVNRRKLLDEAAAVGHLLDVLDEE